MAVPRLGLPSDPSAVSMIKRAKAVLKSTKSMTQYFSQRQIKDALKSRNGHDFTDVHKVPIGPHVLLYRIHRDKYDGPYALIYKRDETCTELDKDRLKEFRTTVVKLYHYSQQPPNDNVAVSNTRQGSFGNKIVTTPAAANFISVFLKKSVIQNSRIIYRKPKTRSKELD